VIDVTNVQRKKKPLKLSGFSLMYTVRLLDDFDYAPRAGVHQNRPIVDDRIAIFANAVLLRNLIIGDARFRKLSADPHVALITVRRAALFNHITAEARPLVYTQNARDAADDPADRAANDSAYRTCRALAFSGTAFNASGHTLG
jgi:hypothetical protein